MSVNPVLAAVVGLVVLDQHLAPTSWAAVMVIVGANTVALTVSAPTVRNGRRTRAG